jgi:hypothetical protein
MLKEWRTHSLKYRCVLKWLNMILKIAKDGFERLKKGPLAKVLKGLKEKRQLLMFDDFS